MATVLVIDFFIVSVFFFGDVTYRLLAIILNNFCFPMAFEWFSEKKFSGK